MVLGEFAFTQDDSKALKEFNCLNKHPPLSNVGSPEDVSHRHGHGDQGQGLGLCNSIQGQGISAGRDRHLLHGLGSLDQADGLFRCLRIGTTAAAEGGNHREI